MIRQGEAGAARGSSNAGPGSGLAETVLLDADLLREAGADQHSAVRTALASLDDAKAEELTTIDIAGKSALGDFMIVASGRSHRHVGAIAERVVSDLKAAGHGPVKVEGLPNCDWVLIDAGDTIVHIFRPEVREFYNIEKMWRAEPDGQARAAGGAPA